MTLLEFTDHLGLDKLVLCGHSMGGKVAMLLALQSPGLVDRLVILDIAPVDYQHSFIPFLDAMSSLNLADLNSRGEADRLLQADIPDTPTRLFLLQNLVATGGEYKWRINIPVISEFMPVLTGFPAQLADGKQYLGDTIFIHGELSDYVIPAYHKRINQYFPKVQISELPGAGHWLHVDQPGQLLARMRAFLS